MYKPTNKMFWEMISHNFYNNIAGGLDLEPVMNPEEKFKLQAEEAQNGILSCGDLELLWHCEEKAQQKEKKMRATFIRRRIVVAVAAAFFSWGAVNTGQAVISFLNEPTFTCESGTHTWTKGDKMWNIADVRCDGNITDATKEINNAFKLTILFFNLQ